MVSFYWAVVTMATLGFGDIKPHTTYEIMMVVMCLTAGFVPSFMRSNAVFASYA